MGTIHWIKLEAGVKKNECADAWETENQFLLALCKIVIKT